VVCNIFSHLLGIVTPTDELIFFKKVVTTNQMGYNGCIMEEYHVVMVDNTIGSILLLTESCFWGWSMQMHIGGSRTQIHDWLVVWNIFYVSICWIVIPTQLTNIFQRGWNHQPDDFCGFLWGHVLPTAYWNWDGCQRCHDMPTSPPTSCPNGLPRICFLRLIPRILNAWL